MPTQPSTVNTLPETIALRFWAHADAVLTAGETAKGLALGLGAGLLAGATSRVVLGVMAQAVGIPAGAAALLVPAVTVLSVLAISVGQLVAWTRANGRSCESRREWDVRLRRDIAAVIGALAGAMASGTGLAMGAAAFGHRA